ncbi:MAG: type II secretion system protein [Candidatus Riflebacteria bacterium]|nr:type II secretion system protein [Candidatus Riflebacteria bacterium]
MNRARQTGFTMTELMIGVSIFAGLTLAFLLSVRATTREIDFSADYFMSILVAQKVGEDLMEETTLNPFALESSGVESPSGITSRLVDGGSVHFSFLEDRAAPWGRIDPGVDGLLSADVQPLYAQVRDFRLRTRARRLASDQAVPDRNLLAVSTEVQWKNQADGRKYESEFQVFSPVTGKKFDETLDVGTLPLTPAALEEETARFFYHLSAEDLKAKIAQSQGDEKAIFELGKVHFLCKGFMQSEYYRKTMQEITTLKKNLASPSGQDLYGTHVALAARWYDLAKTAYRLAFYLERSFDRLMAHPAGLPGGVEGIDQSRLAQCMANFSIIYELFVGGLVQTRSNYLKLLEPGFAAKGGKRQQQIILRLLDIHRILGINPNYPQGLPDYRVFIDQIRTFSEGRLPFLARFMDDERVLAKDPKALLARYPNLKSIHALLADRMPRVLAFAGQTATTGE